MIKRAMKKSWAVSDFNPKEPQAKVWNFMMKMMGWKAGPSIDNTVIKSDAGAPIINPEGKAEIVLETYELDQKNSKI